MALERCGFCRVTLEKIPEGMSHPRIQGKLACERCIDLWRSPPCRFCGERVRDAKRSDPEPYHRECRRCSSCHQIIPKMDVHKLAGKLLCSSCANLFGQFFCPEIRPEADHLKETFSAWDSDGSGFIEHGELGRVLKALDPNLSDTDIHKLLTRVIDKNGDGLIDFTEFCDWVMQGEETILDLQGDSFEDFCNGLMREAGVAAKVSRMSVSEVHVRPDGVMFVLEGGDERFESSAVQNRHVQLVILDPEEFISTLECTEKGLTFVMNTGRTVEVAATGKPWGPWVAPDGFHIVGLRAKPHEGELNERIVGVDVAPLPNAKTYDVGAALRFAAEHEFLSTLRAMVSKGRMDYNSFSPGGVTALMLAAQNGNMGAMRMLVSSKAPVDTTDAEGWTALTFASRCGQSSAVELLLEKGATHEGDGGKAIQLALSQQHNSMARALLRAGFGTAPRGTFALEDLPAEEACILPMPELDPPPAAYNGPVTVSLEYSESLAPPPETDEVGAPVHLLYSLDGRDPVTAGRRYKGPLTLAAPYNNVRVVAVRGSARSAVLDATYVVCHYAIPHEVVSGSLRIRTFPQAVNLIGSSLSAALNVHPERVTVSRSESEAADTGSRWLTVGLRDPMPRHRLTIDRPYTLVKGSKPRQQFIDTFQRDVQRAVGSIPSGIEISAGSIIVDFTLPRESAEELERQLADPTSYLQTQAKGRQNFKEARLSVIQSLGDRLSHPDTTTSLIETFGRKGVSVVEVVCFGSGDGGYVGVMVEKKGLKTLRKVFDKCIAAVLPETIQESLEEGPEKMDLAYSVDVIGNQTVNGSHIVRACNSGEIANKLSELLQERGLPSNVEQGTRASSRNLSQLEFHLKWDYPPSKGKTDAGPVQDFLDGICMVYVESRLAQVIDFRSAHEEHMVHDGNATRDTTDLAKAISRAIQHSGDVMSETGGEHDIQMDLSALPVEVTDIFFVLAAFEADNLASFPNPAVGIYDAHSKRQLTEYHIGSAGEAQAIVMCSLNRPNGRWVVNGLGIPSEGSVRSYDLIRETLAARQSDYLRWDRRQAIVLLRVLHKTGRLTKGSTNEFATLLWAILRIPIEIFQLVVRCL